jgi:hypothetical protein
VHSRGWVTVNKKKVNLILDLEEGDFWYNKCKIGKTAKFQAGFIWLLRSISRKYNLTSPELSVINSNRKRKFS